MKSILTIAISSMFLTIGSTAVASPVSEPAAQIQPEALLLGAKIENAIADIPTERSDANVQNAAYFILARHQYSNAVKSAALEIVIENARSIGDEQVVNALGSISLTIAEPEVRAERNTPTDAKPNSSTPFPPPPAVVTKGGSDY